MITTRIIHFANVLKYNESLMMTLELLQSIFLPRDND